MGFLGAKWVSQPSTGLFFRGRDAFSQRFGSPGSWQKTSLDFLLANGITPRQGPKLPAGFRLNRDIP